MYSAFAFCDGVKITVVLISVLCVCVPWKVMSGRSMKGLAMSTILDQPTSNKRVCTVINDWPQKCHFIELVVDDDSRVRCKICDEIFNFPRRRERHHEACCWPHLQNECFFGKIPIN
jgi:hypothetical protein